MEATAEVGKNMHMVPSFLTMEESKLLSTKAYDDASKARMETSSLDAGFIPSRDNEKKVTEEPKKEGGDPSNNNDSVNSTNTINTASDRNSTNNVNTVSSTINTVGIKVNAVSSNISIELPNDLNIPKLEDIVYLDDYEDVGAEADMNNLNAFMPISPIPTTRIHKDHPVEQIIGDLNSAPQTRRMTKNLEEREEPKKVIHALKDPSLIEAMQDELLQFKLQKMDVKSVFLYGKIKEEVYVRQPSGFEDPDFPDSKSLCTEFERMMHKKFQMSSMGELTFFLGLQVKQKEDGIFISQDKYVTEILKKFGFIDVKTASTPMETQKPLLKDEDDEEVDVHLYRSMIGSLMYLTSSRPDIIYLKGQPKLGLWYLKDSSFDLVAYTDSDYAGESLDMKSTTGEAEYVAASSCCGQVLWIQNQLLDYGDSNEKKLIQMIKIHTDKNVADLLTKAFNKGIGVNAGDSKLMLLGINLLLLGKVNAARHNLLLLVKIIIIEATVRRDLQLEDADGVDYLPNATIFKQLTLISAKTTSWIEFSSTMASAIICLAINQKFNFSKYIFESMVKNLDNAVKLLLYPRFVQVFLNNQLEGMETHNKIYIAPSHAKKIFANIRRQGKDFSGRVTPLFPTMVVQAQEEMGEGSAMPTDPHHIPIITQPSSSQPQRKQKSRRPKEKDTEIPQSSVPKKKGGSRTHKLKRLYRVGRFARVVSSEEASLGDQEDASKQGKKIHDIDADEDITLENVVVNDLDGDEVVVESKVTDKASEKRNIVKEAVVVTDVVTIPVSTKMEESSKKAEVIEESILKRAGDELQQESTKKQKMDDDQERAELQSLMNVIPDEKEVVVDAIPLATKPPSIIDWKIVKKRKISYYQIIRADGSLRRYSAFIQMLRSFDREDLETLWKWVKAKHGYTRLEEGYRRVL
ncbi:uncharacterized mitochondrial protein-like protein [Tanacetum coccineum]